VDLRTFLPALATYAGIADQDLLEKDVRPLLLREIDLEGFEAARRRILGLLESEGRVLRETRGL